MDKKKKVWFWGDNDGGGGTGKEAEDDMAGSMSQYSHSKGLLPSLGATARSSRDANLRRFIISPFDPRYRFLSSFSFHSSLFLFICHEAKQ